MIYDRAVFGTMGDIAVNVEFGDESSIPLNFRILALDFALRENWSKGLVETNPQVRTLGIVYDPLATTRGHVIAHVSELIEARSEVTSLPSRRLIIPARRSARATRRPALSQSFSVSILRASAAMPGSPS